MSPGRYSAGPVKLARQLAYYRRRAEEVAADAEAYRAREDAAGERLLDAEAARLLGEAGRVAGLLDAGHYCRECGRPLSLEKSIAAQRGAHCDRKAHA